MSETTPTLELLKNGVSITDIEAVVIKTASAAYMIKTGTEASMKARVDSGEKRYCASATRSWRRTTPPT